MVSAQGAGTTVVYLLQLFWVWSMVLAEILYGLSLESQQHTEQHICVFWPGMGFSLVPPYEEELGIYYFEEEIQCSDCAKLNHSINSTKVHLLSGSNFHFENWFIFILEFVDRNMAVILCTLSRESVLLNSLGFVSNYLFYLYPAFSK